MNNAMWKHKQHLMFDLLMVTTLIAVVLSENKIIIVDLKNIYETFVHVMVVVGHLISDSFSAEIVAGLTYRIAAVE